MRAMFEMCSSDLLDALTKIDYFSKGLISTQELEQVKKSAQD